MTESSDAGRQGDLGKMVHAELDLHVAPFRDRQRVRKGVGGGVPERPLEFFGRLDVELVRTEPHPGGIRDRLPRLQAEQDLLELVVPGIQVVAVVRRDQRGPGPARKGDEERVHLPLLGQAVVLDLEVESPVREDRSVLFQHLEGLRLALGPQRERDLALQARRGGDQPLRVSPQQFLVDPRLVVEPFRVREGGEPEEVPVPGLVFRQEDQVVGVLPGGSDFPFRAVARGDVDLRADDRLHAPLQRLLVELDRAHHPAVIGDGDGGHPEFLHPRDQGLELDRPVEEAVLRMEVEVDEIFHSHSMVPGGFEEMSYTTRLIPFTSLMIREEIRCSTSYGRRTQSAVIPSWLWTARTATTFSYVRKSPITPTVLMGSRTANDCQISS